MQQNGRAYKEMYNERELHVARVILNLAGCARACARFQKSFRRLRRASLCCVTFKQKSWGMYPLYKWNNRNQTGLPQGGSRSAAARWPAAAAFMFLMRNNHFIWFD